MKFKETFADCLEQHEHRLQNQGMGMAADIIDALPEGTSIRDACEAIMRAIMQRQKEARDKWDPEESK